MDASKLFGRKEIPQQVDCFTVGFSFKEFLLVDLENVIDIPSLILIE
jgi:hypothetical protein